MIHSVSKQVRDLLTKQIEKMAFGERLPSERVLAADYGVSRDTLRRVLKEFVAKGLLASLPGVGYMRSKTEPGLRPSFRQGLLGLILAYNGMNAYDAQLFLGFSRGAREAGKNFAVHTSRSVEEEESMINDFIKHGAVGIGITYQGGNGQQDNVARLRESGVPTIALEYFFRPSPGSYVVNDEEAAMSITMDHLFKAGHEHIAYVCPTIDFRFSASSERQEYFCAGLLARGVTEDEVSASVIDVPYSRLPGAVSTLCARSPRPTAICCNGWMVPRLVACLNSSGLSVPEDVEVISVGGLVNELTVPAMVTDAFEIGRRCGIHLAKMAEDPDLVIQERVAPINALESLSGEYEERMRVNL